MKKFTLLFIVLLGLGIQTATAQCFGVNVISTSSFCNSGTLSVSDTGGVTPFTYSWSPGGQTTSSVTVVSAGTYTITVTDALGCSETGSAIVAAGTLSYSASSNPTSINAGDSSLLIATCNLPSTFSWAPSSSVTFPTSASSEAHPAVTTEYTVTITNSCGTFTDSVLIVVNCFPLSVSSTSACSSSYDGSATITASGGTLPYTYSWSPGGTTTATVTGLSAGGYSVIVTDATGCSSTGVVSVSSASESFSVSGNPTTILTGDSTLLTATSNLAATYSWSPSASITYPDSSSTYAHPTVTTEYTVTITTACGTYTDSVLIVVNCFPLSVSSTSACSSSYDGSATITASGGTLPYTYSWSPGGTTTATVTGLSAGGYSVIVTDATGCSSTGVVSVSSASESFSVSGNPTTILTGDSTLLTATSNLAATYSWAPSTNITYPDSSSTYAHPTVTTEYTVTVTTACGTYTDSVLIVVNCFPLSVSSTSACSSSYDGSATITASGGTLPYTYSWSPGSATTATVTGLSAGGYSVIVTDATGCSSTGVVSVSSASESFSVSGNPTTILTGDSTLLTATSNLAATYSWAPSTNITYPDSSSTYAHPTVTTEYTVTVTTACGTYTDSVLIVVNCFPLSVSSTSACSSSYDGSATITASGGTLPYTYSWSPGSATTATVTGLSAGGYSVIVTDATGCSSTGVVSVSSASESFSVSGNPTTILTGDSTLLTATSNLAATYSWAPSTNITYPDSSSTYAHPTVTTEYTVTVTTACGTFTDSVLINVNCFSVSVTSTSSYCASGTVTATVSGGTSPYTYLWSPGGGTTSSLSGLTAGAYSVVVHDAGGCSATSSGIVSGDTVSYSASGNPTTIVAGDSTLLTATSSSSATYSWAPPASVTYPDSASTYAHPATTTEYTVTITTACGTFTDEVLIAVDCFPISMSSTPSCSGSSSYDGIATVSASGGSSPYTYSWAPGGQTTAALTGLNAGNYSVTVTDATGCSSTGVVSVSSASESFSVSGNPTTILTGDSTLLTATSNLAATYSWAPSTNITYPDSSSTYAHPTVTTEYTVTITTACGTYTDSVLINVNCFPVTMSSTPACSSSYDGSATVTASGGTPPYTYSWSPGGGTTATITGLYSGSYGVTVTDATGCSSMGSVSVSSESESFSVSGNPTTILTGDSTLLTATSNLSATYSWTPSTNITYPDSSSTYAHPGSTTNYTVTITTACGTYTDSVLITVDCFSLVTTSTSSYCSSGTVTATASSGTPPYTYLWAPGGQTTATVSGLPGGVYTVTVHDATGCTVTSTVTVTADSVLYSISGNPLYINTGDSTLLSATCSVPATFSWAPPATVTHPDSASTYAHPTASTYYTVTITTSCATFTDSVLINIQCFPLIMTSTPSYNCSSSYDGSATVTASGGTAPYTYSWSPSGGTTSTITGLYPGNYSVIVSDATGCSASDAVSVSSASISLTVSAFPPVIPSGDSSYLSASVPIAATYSWAPPAGLSCTNCANPWATPTVTTIYTVTVNDTCAGILTSYDTVIVSNCSNNFNEPICIVTIDTATNKSEVIWGRTNSPPATGYGAFYIYRDSSSGYAFIHSQPLDVLSEYIDPTSDPSAGPVSYELATLDSCGESALSAPHTSIYLTISAGVNVYILNWTAYIGFTPSVYRIFRGASMSTLVQIDSVSPTTLTFHDTLPPVNSLYLVEAVNPSGPCVPTTHRPIRPSEELSGSLSNGFYTSVLGVQPIANSITNLNIYPNPSNGQFTLQWSVGSGQSSDIQINIINELGQIVYSENKQSNIGINTEQLNLSNLATGIYTLRMQSNSNMVVRKLLILKQL